MYDYTVSGITGLALGKSKTEKGVSDGLVSFIF